MSGKAGMEKVLDAAADALRDQAQPPAGEQLALLPGAEPEKRGRGRPEGARARSTEEMVRYLHTFGENPLVGLARICASVKWIDGKPDFTELAKALGMKKAGAADFWRRCATDLAPFMAQKLPMAIDIKGGHDGDLIIINRGAVQGDPLTRIDQLPGHTIGEVVDAESEPIDQAKPSEENQ